MSTFAPCTAKDVSRLVLLATFLDIAKEVKLATNVPADPRSGKYLPALIIVLDDTIRSGNSIHAE